MEKIRSTYGNKNTTILAKSLTSKVPLKLVSNENRSSSMLKLKIKNLRTIDDQSIPQTNSGRKPNERGPKPNLTGVSSLN
jgi:hypothetical protein